MPIYKEEATMPSGWERRARKIENRRDNKSFSKPFKKRNVESKKKVRIRLKIKEAQRAKYDAINSSDNEE